MAGGIRSSFRTQPGRASDAPTIDGLFEACSERFPSPDFSVVRDETTETVWVSRDGEQLAVGLRPGMVERRGLEKLLASTEQRLSAFRESER